MREEESVCRILDSAFEKLSLCYSNILKIVSNTVCRSLFGVAASGCKCPTQSRCFAVICLANRQSGCKGAVRADFALLNLLLQKAGGQEIVWEGL